MLYEVQFCSPLIGCLRELLYGIQQFSRYAAWKKEKCCLLYNNLESGAGIRRGMLYLVQDFSGIPENAPPTANGRFIGNVNS